MISIGTVARKPANPIKIARFDSLRKTAALSSTEALCAHKKAPPVGRGAEVFEDAHANNGVSWQGLECPNGKRMSLKSILNFEATWLSSPGPNTVSPICAQSGTYAAARSLRAG